MTTRCPQVLADALGLLRSPVAAVGLGLVCLLDACTLPSSTLGGSVFSSPRISRYCGGWIDAEIHRVAGQLVLVPYGNPAPSGSESSIHVSYRRPRRQPAGAWAATASTTVHRLRLDGVSAVEEPIVRTMFADYLLTAGDGRLADEAPLIRAGNTVTTEVLVSGYIHNAVSALLFSGLAASLAMFRSWPVMVEFRERRAVRAVELGLCPRCRYDTKGLSARRCPECGAEW